MQVEESISYFPKTHHLGLYSPIILNFERSLSFSQKFCKFESNATYGLANQRFWCSQMFKHLGNKTKNVLENSW